MVAVDGKGGRGEGGVVDREGFAGARGGMGRWME